jgi:hypothetical protein
MRNDRGFDTVAAIGHVVVAGIGSWPMLDAADSKQGGNRCQKTQIAGRRRR